MIFKQIPFLLFFKREKLKKKRNEKECFIGSETEVVRQGLLKKNTLWSETKKEDFFDSNPKGLTLTNARSVAIFAFPFYFFLGKNYIIINFQSRL